MRGAYAAGKLTVGFWDHWVPGANDTLTKLCNEWAAKEKVEIKIDYITSQGDKLNLTQAAEAQARSGHDMLTFLAWAAAAQADNLEPVDDIMAPLIAANGKISEGIEYVAKQKGHWIARAGVRRQPDLAVLRAASTCSRSMSASISPRCIRPARRPTRNSPTTGPGTSS